ncbi:MAG: hypothetical protein ACLRFR_04320, partial [Clostridia bacterium]
MEIKWGNALPNSYSGGMSSGNLIGYPYFTTIEEEMVYYWVIIGRNADVSIWNSSLRDYIFSD